MEDYLSKKRHFDITFDPRRGFFFRVSFVCQYNVFLFLFLAFATGQKKATSEQICKRGGDFEFPCLICFYSFDYYYQGIKDAAIQFQKYKIKKVLGENVNFFVQKQHKEGNHDLAFTLALLAYVQQS